MVIKDTADRLSVHGVLEHCRKLGVHDIGAQQMDKELVRKRL